MSTFLAATAVAREGNRYIAAIDPEWFIWGPFGGYLAALALRAMGMHSAQRRPATFSCQYLNSGEAGPVAIEIITLKSGRRAECLRASLTQGRNVLLEAQSWIIADDLTGLTHEHACMPGIPPVSELAPWDGFGDPEARAPIWKHFERRPKEFIRGPGYPPGKPEWSCWVRLAEAVPADDLMLQAARAVLWMDMAPWNAGLIAHPWPTTHIAPTLDLTVQFQSHLYAPDVIASEWLLVTTESPTAAAGLFGAHGTLWSERGKLVAVGAAQALCVPNPRYEMPSTDASNARGRQNGQHQPRTRTRNGG